MSYSLKLATAPATEPITLAQAKAQVRVELDSTEYDDDLTSLIVESRQYLEAAVGRQLVTATWDLAIDSFPPSGRINVPLPPLQSVTWVKYYDADNTLQTLETSNYVVWSDGSEGGRIYQAADVLWPTTYTRPDAVQVRFVAGYGTADQVPAPLKRAMKLLLGHWFANREESIGGTMNVIPHGVDRVVAMFRPGDEWECYDAQDD